MAEMKLGEQCEQVVSGVSAEGCELKGALAASEAEVERLREYRERGMPADYEIDMAKLRAALERTKSAHERQKVRADVAESALDEAREELAQERKDKGWLRIQMSDDEFCGLFADEQVRASSDHWRSIAEAMAGECCEEKCSHNCCSHKIRAILDGSGEGER